MEQNIGDEFSIVVKLKVGTKKKLNLVEKKHITSIDKTIQKLISNMRHLEINLLTSNTNSEENLELIDIHLQGVNVYIKDLWEKLHEIK